MEELLFPRTDAGVVGQGVIVGLLFVLGYLRVRHDRDVRLFVVGLAVLTAGLFALRSAH